MKETPVHPLISPTDRLLGRRQLIAGGVLGATGLMMPAALTSAADPSYLQASAGPAPARAALPEQRLALRCVHTGRRCDAVFKRGERFDSSGLAELDQGLRDWRTGDATAMDRDLLMLLANVRDTLGVAASTPFLLISGFRSSATNAALHARSGQVATKSQHMIGRAVDIALDGIPLSRIRDAGLAMRRGGVGFYPKDGFVHLDTGRLRRW
jgi:uncharacterized protein YcbK (DUF882 family)